MSKNLNKICKRCGFTLGRHSGDGEYCPLSRKTSPGGLRIDGMRYILKNEFMKQKKFKDE